MASSGTANAVPRPARGFTTKRAQKWVLTVAVLDALIYLVRHLIEGETSPAPATNAARRFLGQGSPPSFSQWIIAYGASFLGLALLAAAAPELAASLAMFVLAATFIESGAQFAKDLGTLGAGGPTIPTGSSSVPASLFNEPDQTGNPAAPLNLSTSPFAPSPSSVGAGVLAQETAPNPPGSLAASIPGWDVLTQQGRAKALQAKINQQINTPAWKARNGGGSWTTKTVNGVFQILHNGQVWNG